MPRDEKHIMGQGSTPERDGPVSDQEIIPSDRAHARSLRGRSSIGISVNAKGSGRFAYVATPGPFAIILALLVLGILLAVILLFLLGALLIWIPILVVLVAALLLSGLFRGYFRQLR